MGTAHTIMFNVLLNIREKIGTVRLPKGTIKDTSFSTSLLVTNWGRIVHAKVAHNTANVLSCLSGIFILSSLTLSKPRSSVAHREIDKPLLLQ